MENAADALKMAAAVLVFVVALSISINAFGQARRTTQTILEYKDREYEYTYINDETAGITCHESHKVRGVIVSNENHEPAPIIDIQNKQ